MSKVLKNILMSAALLCSLMAPSMQSQAGVLEVFGDVNSMSDNTAARNQLLSNLLGNGKTMLESKQNGAFPTSFTAGYVKAGVTKTSTSAELTTSILSGVDLLLVNIGCCNGSWSNPYSTGEISTMATFLLNGGSIGILEEPCCTDTSAVSGMNSMLAALGSTMHYTSWYGDSGTATMTSAMGVGVTNYVPNTFGDIQGGTAVATLNGKVAIAYENVGSADVPEPASLALCGLSLLGLGAMRQRRG